MENIKKEIRESIKENEIIIKHLDLISLKSVREFADSLCDYYYYYYYYRLTFEF